MPRSANVEGIFPCRKLGCRPGLGHMMRSSYQSREMRIADYLLGHDCSRLIATNWPLTPRPENTAPNPPGGPGKFSGTNFIVMPIADVSLQQRIASADGLNEKEALDAGSYRPGTNCPR